MSKEIEQCCFVTFLIVCLVILGVVWYVEDIYASSKTADDTDVASLNSQ